MRLVRLVAPVDGCDFYIGDKKYAIAGGDRSVDVPEDMVPRLLVEGFKRAEASQVVVMQGPKGDIGIEGKQGETGPRGPAGPRGEMGPMPRHEWQGTQLRFELDVGVWGEFTDLEGPPGKDGSPAIGGGIFGASSVTLGGGGGSTNSYFPAGW